MNRKIVFLVTLVAHYGQTHAVKLIVKTQSAEPIFVYVNNVNELRVTEKNPKSLELDQQKINKIMAVNELGTVTSDFYTITIPQDAPELTINANIENKKITFNSTPPKLLVKE